MLVLFKKLFGNKPDKTTDSGAKWPEQIVAQIQVGDETLRNTFIAEYQEYVGKVASRYCKRYIDPAKNDEFTVALAAFNEAIDEFNTHSDRAFLSYAEGLIERRLFDYIQMDSRYSDKMGYSSSESRGTDDVASYTNVFDASTSVFDTPPGRNERQSEIQDLEQVLEKFNMDFNDLVEQSPEDTDSRKMFYGIGRILANDPGLMRLLLSERKLPVKELQGHVNVSRKILNRHQEYITAIALIYNGPFPYVREYLRMKQESSPQERGDRYE
ncbi:RNA polymerase subunit sigma [Paenibacillus sp. N1-5-1-14]|uniref:RNA polymerase subunit sigma n=1 Tax=Paenibacillus radicibacter TaxID=2972488 RepID=UPI0021595E90|nr:RNA polymerase subunit sigma [Paenibacillus radicibacter]MCR8644951.1 RNA polymerase subunit sigma [Paenibacillus radicibacter]